MTPEVGPGTEAPPLPAGFRVTADPGTRRVDRGRIVIGGAPLRLLRLTPAGGARLAGWMAGEPVLERPADQRLARRLLHTGIVHPAPPPIPEDALGEVTIVIPTHDRPDRVSRVLGALSGASAATIVVDDASPDHRGIAEVATRWGARLIRNERALGPAAARNRGWRAATTEQVLFVDTDCHNPQPGPGRRWLLRLIRQLSDPEVGVVAPRIVTATSDCTSAARSIGRLLADYELTRSPLDQGRAPARVHPQGRVRYVPAAALLVRRRVLETLNGFDESMRFGEDVDLVWRADRIGISVRYDPSASLAHEPRADIRSWLRQRYQYGSSAAALDLRHPGFVSPATVPMPTAASWLATVLGRPAVGTTLALANGARVQRLVASLDDPPREARRAMVRLVTQSHLHGGRALADAGRRVWWPLLALAMTTRTGRRLTGAAFLPLVLEAAELAAADQIRWVNAPTWLVLRVADDAAYGAGVWAGSLRGRRIGALVPRFTR